MVTLQEGNLVPVAFGDMIDPETNRTRIRLVDLNSYSYRVARAYMIRLEQSDFESPTMLAALAAERGMTSQEFRDRYFPFVEKIGLPCVDTSEVEVLGLIDFGPPRGCAGILRFDSRCRRRGSIRDSAGDSESRGELRSTQ